MNTRIGSFINQTIAGETYKAYLPAKLPPTPPLDLAELYPLIEKATLALAQLNSLSHIIPSKSLFTYMYARKEALLSSQIEGTQSSMSDLMLFENNKKSSVSIEDVEEVSNYVKAINYGLERINSGFPLSLKLLKEIHAILLSGARGSSKLPGEFRRSQNWIGGTRPGNALFVQPPVDSLDECLGDLEKFLHDESLPVLIRAGLAHVQFETIHPFLDGNGRLGRLLITLILCSNKIIDAPILYLSLYLKQNRALYYELLQEVRTRGNWETWLEFFLNGVLHSAEDALRKAKEINELFASDLEKINQLGRARFACESVLESIKKLPQVTASFIASNAGISLPTARNSLNTMASAGILEEISGKKRDKIYVYRKYLDILEDGAQPF